MPCSRSLYSNSKRTKGKEQTYLVGAENNCIYFFKDKIFAESENLRAVFRIRFFFTILNFLVICTYNSIQVYYAAISTKIVKILSFLYKMYKRTKNLNTIHYIYTIRMYTIGHYNMLNVEILDRQLPQTIFLTRIYNNNYNQRSPN